MPAFGEAPEVRVITCDVGGLCGAKVGVVDALARLQLIVRRSSCRICLHNASTELVDLINLMGLSAVLPLGENSGVETRGQSE